MKYSKDFIFEILKRNEIFLPYVDHPKTCGTLSHNDKYVWKKDYMKRDGELVCPLLSVDKYLKIASEHKTFSIISTAVDRFYEEQVGISNELLEYYKDIQEKSEVFHANLRKRKAEDQLKRENLKKQRSDEKKSHVWELIGEDHAWVSLAKRC